MQCVAAVTLPGQRHIGPDIKHKCNSPESTMALPARLLFTPTYNAIYQIVLP